MAGSGGGRRSVHTLAEKAGTGAARQLRSARSARVPRLGNHRRGTSLGCPQRDDDAGCGCQVAYLRNFKQPISAASAGIQRGAPLNRHCRARENGGDRGERAPERSVPMQVTADSLAPCCTWKESQAQAGPVERAPPTRSLNCATARRRGGGCAVAWADALRLFSRVPGGTQSPSIRPMRRQSS